MKLSNFLDESIHKQSKNSIGSYSNNQNFENPSVTYGDQQDKFQGEITFGENNIKKTNAENAYNDLL